MKMAKNFELSVGVDDYCFSLINHCTKNCALPINVCISFNLTGDFLLAAVKDDIAYTVNYESLCLAILNEIKRFDCASFLKAATSANNAILNHSRLIAGGTFTMTMQCHDSFTKIFHLL